MAQSDPQPGPGTPPKQRGEGVSDEPAVRGEIRTTHLVDETGATIPVDEEKAAINAGHGEKTVGATGPTSWWRWGIALMAILIALLLILQWIGTGTPTPSG